MYPLTEIKNLSPYYAHQTIRIRGRIFSKKDCGKILFVILRDGLHTLQAVVVKAHKEGEEGGEQLEAYHALRKVENESFVEFIGRISVVQQAVLACSQKWVELEVMHYTILSRSVLELPITVKEATFIGTHQQAERPNLPPAHLHKRLDNRVLD